MKRYLLFIILLAIGIAANAQCPLNVSIVSVPDVSIITVCKSTPVQLEANPSAGAVGPQYIWVVDGDTVFGADSIINILANNQNIQVYMGTSTGCPQDTVSISIQVQTVLIQSTVNILNYNCALDEADIQINSSGGTAIYNYDLVGIGTSATGAYNNVPVGTYDLYITDAQGCNDTNVVVIVPVPETIESVYSTSLVCNQTVTDVQITATGGTPSYSYDLVGIGTNSSGTYNDVPLGSYILYTADNNGCIDTSEVVIIPITCPPPLPTEVITPNGDGYNDMWRISNIQFYPDNEVFIFDRWGQRVYHKEGYENADGWEAKYVGANMPVSTYYYILKISIEESDDIVIKGPISVFR
ncbi:MAG: gliding motility-associated C-terminal domain-containing protein [Flavobacteriales bacterium]|nr:gliding motility-associated C-terminal domain-containing protein [Flavobacteriales bacterium]